MKIIVGIPAFNEEKNIASIIERLYDITDKIIVCNDGSSDRTSSIASRMGVEVIDHATNMGYGSAIWSIFDRARKSDCDILVTFDADGQHRIQDINLVLEPILKDKADIVIGSRFLNEVDDVPKYRKFGIKTITVLTNAISGSNITDAQSGFRAYNKKALERIVPSDAGMGVSTEILIKAANNKLRITEIPITILYEGDTSTHNPVSHGASVVLSTVKFVALERPLTFYGIPGMIFLVIGLFFVGWTLQNYATSREIITNVTLIGTGCTILGVLLLMTSSILYSMINIIREIKK